MILVCSMQVQDMIASCRYIYMLFWGNWVLGNRGWHVMQLAQGEKLEYQKYTNAVKDIIMLDGPITGAHIWVFQARALVNCKSFRRDTSGIPLPDQRRGFNTRRNEKSKENRVDCRGVPLYRSNLITGCRSCNSTSFPWFLRSFSSQ
jgi:hypothetical protein